MATASCLKGSLNGKSLDLLPGRPNRETRVLCLNCMKMVNVSVATADTAASPQRDKRGSVFVHRGLDKVDVAKIYLLDIVLKCFRASFAQRKPEVM